MLRVVILSILVAQLQGLQTSLGENAKMDNQQYEQQLEYSSQQAKRPEIVARIEMQGDVLVELAQAAGKDLKSSIKAGEKMVEAADPSKSLRLDSKGRVLQILPVVIIVGLAVNEMIRMTRLRRTSSWSMWKVGELLFALLLYMISGPAIILVNKHIMREHGFHFPILLASLGNALLMVVTRGAVAAGVHKLQTSSMEWRRYFRVVIPVICLNFAAQVTGMWAYIFISVPEVQILKSITIVAVLILAYFIVNEPLSWKLATAVLIIAGGTCLSACFDAGAGGTTVQTAGATAVGILLCLFASFCEAGKTVFCQVLMDNLNVFDGLYWSSPMFTAIAVVFVAAIELKSLVHHIFTLPLVGLLVLNAALTGIIVLSSFWMTKLVGALVLKVLMQARTIGLILASVLFFRESCASMQYVGYSISLIGMILFSSAKNSAKESAFFFFASRGRFLVQVDPIPGTYLREGGRRGPGPEGRGAS